MPEVAIRSVSALITFCTGGQKKHAEFLADNVAVADATALTEAGFITQIYSGNRWSFTCMVVFSILFGFGSCFFWPPVQNVISQA